MTLVDIWEVIKDVDVNNVVSLLMIGVILIILLASCIDSFWASGIEVLLMDKVDLVKRSSLAYIILFVGLGMTNYFVAIDEWITSIYTIIFLSAFPLYIILQFLYKILKFSKGKAFFLKYGEHMWLLVIMMFFSLVTSVSVKNTEVIAVSWSIIWALVEVIVIVLLTLNHTKRISEITLSASDKKWYVFKRMNDFLLCGDKNSADTSKEFKLFKLDDIENFCFKKDIEN